MFQFLIGTLKTFDEQMVILVEKEFQFLIGTLKTWNGSYR